MAEALKSIRHQITQPAASKMCPIKHALDQFSSAGMEKRGAIFTRHEVVEFILDLAGYTANRPLHKFALLEPSFGDGDFLLVVIERLLAARRQFAPDSSPNELSQCIRAVELHQGSFERIQLMVLNLLRNEGFPLSVAEQIADHWLIRGDFLLTDFIASFDFVIGNPPYIRQELIPDPLIAEYRERYHTVFDRADIYIPFIEHSLELLAPGGTLGFICADRWMKNRYGGPLRQMVASRFHLKIYVDMVDTPAFHSNVIAYPAITVITREKPGTTKIAHRPDINRVTLSALAKALLASGTADPKSTVKEMGGIASGPQPWILESSDQLGLLRRLEQDFPIIEDAGCKVGIGVATGADKAFIGPFDELDVENDRKLPLVMTRDILSGEVAWRGLGVVNPFADGGGLVDLREYPRLRRYLEARKDQIDKRHIARKAPASWYRTIDRIYPKIAKKPKLLIPDIKGTAHIVYEQGLLYPHHNLYFITSDEWDLQALQAVLLSGIARLFVATYSTRMRGGYLRFQAQYLRRIRLPHWSSVSPDIMESLITAARERNVAACNEAVFRLYGLTADEQEALGGNGT